MITKINSEKTNTRTKLIAGNRSVKQQLVKDTIRKVYLFYDSAPCTPQWTDIQRVRAYLKENRLYTNVLHNADRILLFTCAFRKSLENNSCAQLSYVRQHKKKSARVVVLGCLPSINKKRLDRIFKGVSISENNLSKLDEILPVKKRLSDIGLIDLETYPQKKLAKRYFLRVGSGCYGACSYCAIKNVFPQPRSRPISEVLKEFNQALDKGYRDFALVANELGCYGLDNGSTIVDLINALAKSKEHFSLFLSNFHPADVRRYLPQLKKFLQSNMISTIYIACQAGSDKILSLMKRGYTVADFKYCVRQIHAINPKIKIKTDFIVGFPQETRDDFSDNLQLIRWLSQFNTWIQSFEFSKRPHTLAGQMKGQLSRAETYKRALQASRLIRFLGLSYLESENAETLREMKTFVKQSRKMLRSRNKLN